MQQANKLHKHVINDALNKTDSSSIVSSKNVTSPVTKEVPWGDGSLKFISDGAHGNANGDIMEVMPNTIIPMDPSDQHVSIPSLPFDQDSNNWNLILDKGVTLGPKNNSDILHHYNFSGYVRTSDNQRTWTHFKSMDLSKADFASDVSDSDFDDTFLADPNLRSINLDFLDRSHQFHLTSAFNYPIISSDLDRNLVTIKLNPRERLNYREFQSNPDSDSSDNYISDNLYFLNSDGNDCTDDLANGTQQEGWYYRSTKPQEIHIYDESGHLIKNEPSRTRGVVLPLKQNSDYHADINNQVKEHVNIPKGYMLKDEPDSFYIPQFSNGYSFFNIIVKPQPHAITVHTYVPVYINGKSSGTQQIPITGLNSQIIQLTDNMATDKFGYDKSVNGNVLINHNHGYVHGQINYTGRVESCSVGIPIYIDNQNSGTKTANVVGKVGTIVNLGSDVAPDKKGYNKVVKGNVMIIPKNEYILSNDSGIYYNRIPSSASNNKSDDYLNDHISNNVISSNNSKSINSDKMNSNFNRDPTNNNISSNNNKDSSSSNGNIVPNDDFKGVNSYDNATSSNNNGLSNSNRHQLLSNSGRMDNNLRKVFPTTFDSDSSNNNIQSNYSGGMANSKSSNSLNHDSTQLLSKSLSTNYGSSNGVNNSINVGTDNNSSDDDKLPQTGESNNKLIV